jgi:hypothetical protein
MKLGGFSTDFQESTKISNFMKIRPVRAESERQTDMTKLIVAFLDFAYAPKNGD